MPFCKNLQQIVLLWLIQAVTIAASQVTLPGCQEKCGNISIPYPFGTTKGCYLNSDFFVACNTSYTPPKPFLWGTSVELLNISLYGQLSMYTWVAKDCYNESGAPELDLDIFTYANLKSFFFSVTRNIFVGVGCDTFATIIATSGNEYATGCFSTCSSIDSVINGSCSGIGCCQTSIPKMLQSNNIIVQSFQNHTRVWSFNPCSYAFLVEEEYFSFSVDNFTSLLNTSVVPTVLDWAVGNQTCKEAERNLTSYACQENSYCYDSDNGPGYSCSCSEGYQGNPYLPNGCKDIDECANPKLNDCEKKCINLPGNYTCSCPEGYNGDGREGGQGCIFDQLLLIKIMVGIGVGLAVLLVGSGWLYIGLKKRKLIKLKEKYFRQNGGLLLQQELSRREGYTDTAKIFTAEELKNATNNYEESKIIGRGGYGIVYKGILPDNKIVAIKKSKIVDKNQTEQFINEVVVLSQINHRNVVKLLGCCLETEVPLLVYEFVSNGNLFDHIHNASKASAISWEMRLRIAAEAAGVLAYLHSEASTTIIHRDVKSTNILLDENYTAKVSDFGASKLVPLDQAGISTMVQGTLGYLDPEYLHTSQLTEKSDVYSFGVVIVELLTGQKALSFDRPEEERSLAMYFLTSLKEDRLCQVVEDCIVNEGKTEWLKEVANLAKKCLKVKGEDRPSMKEVAMELEGLKMAGKHPWVNAAVNLGETEHLLGKPSDDIGYVGMIA